LGAGTVTAFNHRSGNTPTVPDGDDSRSSHRMLISTTWLPALQPAVFPSFVTAMEATDTAPDAWHRTYVARITRSCTTIGRRNREHDS